MARRPGTISPLFAILGLVGLDKEVLLSSLKALNAPPLIYKIR